MQSSSIPILSKLNKRVNKINKLNQLLTLLWMFYETLSELIAKRYQVHTKISLPTKSPSHVHVVFGFISFILHWKKNQIRKSVYTK